MRNAYIGTTDGFLPGKLRRWVKYRMGKKGLARWWRIGMLGA